MDESVWTPAYNSDGQVWEGAWVAELTGMLNLEGWPRGMRVIVGKERPHPGAQLRITDSDGLRVTAWMQLLALTSRNARRWEPKRRRRRLFTIAARLTRDG